IVIRSICMAMSSRLSPHTSLANRLSVMSLPALRINIFDNSYSLEVSRTGVLAPIDCSTVQIKLQIAGDENSGLRSTAGDNTVRMRSTNSGFRGSNRQDDDGDLNRVAKPRHNKLAEH